MILLLVVDLLDYFIHEVGLNSLEVDNSAYHCPGLILIVLVCHASSIKYSESLWIFLKENV